MAYSNANDLKASMESAKSIVPCMTKTAGFGVAGCPHCRKANEIFENARAGIPGFTEDAGRAVYAKKMFFSFGLIGFPGKPQHGQLALVQWPTDRAVEIIDALTTGDERVRWPEIDDINAGNIVILSKFKKDDKYSDYKVQIVRQPAPVDAAWWEQVKAGIPAMDNFAHVVMAFNNWDKQNKLIPAKDMQNGNNVDIRVLPSSGNVPGRGIMPICLTYMHYVDVLTDWDKAWREVNFDVSRYNEVMAKAGNQMPTSSPAGAYGPSTAVSPSPYVQSLLQADARMGNLPPGM